MGKSKELLYDMQQEQMLQDILIEHYGITYEDCLALHFDHEEVDALCPTIRFTFLEGSDTSLLEKMNVELDQHVDILYQQDDGFDLEEAAVLLGIVSPINTLMRQLDSIDSLIPESNHLDRDFNLLVMLHAHCIASLESYFSIMFIQEVKNNKDILQKIVA
jgi:hypothetical protein